jgi:hypothetical protein
MYTRTVYYSVSNCGDGSAYPQFFDEADLADAHQEYIVTEGWGEDCVGTLVLTSESPINATESEVASRTGEIARLKKEKSEGWFPKEYQEYFDAIS